MSEQKTPSEHGHEISNTPVFMIAVHRPVLVVREVEVCLISEGGHKGEEKGRKVNEKTSLNCWRDVGW